MIAPSLVIIYIKIYWLSSLNPLLMIVNMVAVWSVKSGNLSFSKMVSKFRWSRMKWSVNFLFLSVNFIYFSLV